MDPFWVISIGNSEGFLPFYRSVFTMSNRYLQTSFYIRKHNLCVIKPSHICNNYLINIAEFMLIGIMVYTIIVYLHKNDVIIQFNSVNNNNVR